MHGVTNIYDMEYDRCTYSATVTEYQLEESGSNTLNYERTMKIRNSTNLEGLQQNEHPLYFSRSVGVYVFFLPKRPSSPAFFVR